MNNNRRLRWRMSLLLAALLIVASSPLLAAEGHDHGNHAHEKNTTQQSSSSKSPYEIHFRTHPRADEIVPDQDMVELIFEVTRNGEPARGTELSYRVYAPPKTFWFGTDFPIVEGSQLLSGSVFLPTGNQVISMILPIRGNYKVKTTVRGQAGVQHKTFRFSVSENPSEVLNLAIFLGILFLVGGVGGYVLSGGRSAGKPAGWLLPLGVATLALAALPNVARAHGQGNWDPHSLENQLGSMTLRRGVKLDVETFPRPVSVGEMLTVHYDVTVPDAKPHPRDPSGNRPPAGEASPHTNQHNHGEPGNQGSREEHGHHEKKPHSREHPDSRAHQEHEQNHGKPPTKDLVLAESHFVHSEGGLEMVTQSSWLKHGRGTIRVQLFDGAPHYLVTRFYRPTHRYAPASGHKHGHGDKAKASGHEASDGKPPWEAETHYELEAGTYRVEFGPSKDPNLQWLLLPLETNHPGETARRRMEECESLEPGGTMEETGTCYNLTLNDDGTDFLFQVPESGTYRLFTQHLPREFDMTVKRDGSAVNPVRKFIPGKGEYLGRRVEWVEVNPVQPPLDDIVKSMLTLLAVVALGFYLGYRRPGFSG